MAWMPPLLLDIPNWATDEEARDIWESNRQRHNDFANQFNNDFLNRIWFKLGKASPISLMPSYEEMKKEFYEQKNNKREQKS